VDSKTADRVVDSLAAMGLCRRTAVTVRKDAPLTAGPAAAVGGGGAGEERCEMAVLPHLGPDDPAVRAVAVCRFTAAGIGAATGVCAPRRLAWPRCAECNARARPCAHAAPAPATRAPAIGIDRRLRTGPRALPRPHAPRR
jgi:hypothetical protein